MKKIISILFVALLFSCSKDAMPYNNEFKESEQAWNTYKNSVNNSYAYTSYFSSIFGYHTETKITVRNGKVTNRSFIAGMYSDNLSQLDTTESWTEDIATLNTHTNGAESLTLDDIYSKATTDWLSVDTKTNDTYFSTDTNGLIASCGYVAKGCQDDCFTGVRIRDITGL